MTRQNSFDLRGRGASTEPVPDVDEDLRAAEAYFASWWQWLRSESAEGGLRGKWRERQPRPPVAAMQTAARQHPNAKVRRDALSVLDHHANDLSTSVFRDALRDPVPRVRAIALHGLACERCRETELCAADVVPALVAALLTDPSARVRHGCVPILMRLAGRDARAGDALRRAAADDADPLVRECATAALEGRFRDVRSRKALRRRARRVGTDDPPPSA